MSADLERAEAYAYRVIARWPLVPRLAARLTLTIVYLLTWRPGRG